MSIRAPLLLLAAAVAAVCISSTADAVRVHPKVHRTLRAQGTVNLIVTFKDSTDSVLESVKEVEYATRGAKITDIVERLEVHASKSQAPLDALIDDARRLEGAAGDATPLFKSKKSFWISNQVYFEAATFELVEKLSTLAGVSDIREEKIIPMPEPIVSLTNSSNTEAVGPEWGISKIGALDVWAKGYIGQGIVVGVIDTGVMGEHNALKFSFRADHGWYDPYDHTTFPMSTNGHGTHVAGIIAGANGIGVAPGAKWVACRGCVDSCGYSELLECGQFMTCPTNVDGSDRNCFKAPHVVSNSWAGGQGDTGYQAVVNLWRATSVIPVFAIGNSGATACDTALSPGDLEAVIGVGSTNINDALAGDSGKGPTKDKRMKPDISAPGMSIRSSWNAGVNEYVTLSGTSMATPHLSGVIALMLSANPRLTYDQVKEALTSTAERNNLGATGFKCGNPGTPDSTFPNNQYGNGRVNALAAVNRALTL